MKVLNAMQRDLLQRFATNQLSDLELEQVTALLRRFIRGELDEEESNEVIEVLANHDQCIALLDQLWIQQPVGQALAATPDLDNEVAIRLENKLVRQIHRSNMARTVFKMGTQGFFSVALGLIRPLTQRNRLKPRRKRNKR